MTQATAAVSVYSGGMRAVREFDPSALRRAREAAGLTQADVAARLGQERTNYLAYELGRRAPTAPTLVELARIVEVKPSQLTRVRPDQATLRELREWAGLVQSDVAAHLEREKTSWRRIEQGKKQLTDEEAATLAPLFGVSPEELLGAAERTRKATDA